MKTVCHKEYYFSTSEKKEFCFGFNGGNITSDGGSLLIAQAIKKMGLTDNMTNCLNDRRNPEKVTYTLGELLEQRIILDIDSTDDKTHGKQEGYLFNGFYQETMYSQLLVFDAETRELITENLRPGNIYTSYNATVTIHRIVKELNWRRLKRIPSG